MSNYRKLTAKEIAYLEAHNNTAEDWNRVHVSLKFSPVFIESVHFSGDIRLGAFDGIIELEGGIQLHSGLRRAVLHNCTIGDNVLIENVQNQIANYDIGAESVIRNINLLVVTGRSRFGNGTEVSVLNETGGREVMIYNQLSAHSAYLMALHRHRNGFAKRIRDMIERYSAEQESDHGRIGSHARILNCNLLRNLSIGDYAIVEGAARLENGTLNSCSSDPVYIGCNVIMQDFIVCSGARITDGAALVRCFVGQACRLGHLFSAHDSLFFSNCKFENGEACAIFAGPYTVSMHKSSLLIAGMFSFLNAGSGSNQSNHMYKLGPIHQGIVERGSKTTSDSYILWPARIGAFSLVMGRHVHHPDTSDLPFSYLIEREGETYLSPGVNLRSVGTVRDARKWPERDARKGAELLDCINFNLLSPYSIGKMLKAVDTLEHLQQVSGEASSVYSFQSTRITRPSLLRGLNLYRTAIVKFLGNSLIKRLEGDKFSSEEDMRQRLRPTSSIGSGEWIDLSGLIVPRTEVDALAAAVETGEISQVAQLNARFALWHANYYDMEWTWAIGIIERYFGVNRDTLTSIEVAKIVRSWQEAVISLDRMLYEDARKEFSISARIGFGVDGEDAAHSRQMDFESVRGCFESNPFVMEVCRHIEDKRALGDELLARLSLLDSSIETLGQNSQS